MRQIGTLPNENNASRFAAYLITQGIAAHSEQDGEEWAVWVRDEDDMDDVDTDAEDHIGDECRYRVRFKPRKIRSGSTTGHH